MKKLISIIFLFAFLLSGCWKKGCKDPLAINYDEDAMKDDGSCEYRGTITFWINDEQNSYTYIYINSERKGVLISYYPNGYPDCKTATACVRLVAKPGNYFLRASIPFGKIWEDTVTIRANECALYLLD